MKLIEALSERGRPFEIPDASRDDLPALFTELGFKVGAEIGVYKGENLRLYCQAGLKMYGIDPWAPSWVGQSQERAEYLYQKARRNLRPWLESGSLELLRMTSLEAAARFADESLDFVYIDGDHRFPAVAADLAAWTYKVKRGGIISGHDYQINRLDARDPMVTHVAPALWSWLGIIRQRHWYVIGRERAAPGEKRDKYRSWFWVRQ